MVLLDSAAARYVRSWLGDPREPCVLDLHHALAHHRRGLWGDDARAPHSVLLMREGFGQLEAFGAGEPEPAVAWLSRRAGRPLALLAPPDWRDVVGRRFKPVERNEILTLTMKPGVFNETFSPVVTRRLTLDDSETFRRTEAAPEWALLAWTSFADLIEHGVGFAVPYGDDFAALAWIYSQTKQFDAIGVFTLPRFRGLGLGRAAASALLTHIVSERAKVPIWTTTPSNAGSLALAESLGFTQGTSETLLKLCPALPSPRNPQE